MKKKTDDFLPRIEAFNKAEGGGVAVRKAAKGYSLFRLDTGAPIARLRPTRKGDKGEVLFFLQGVLPQGATAGRRAGRGCGCGGMLNKA